MNEKHKRFFICLSAIIGTVGICIGIYRFANKVNYGIAYKSLVKETVREMVREECLK